MKPYTSIKPTPSQPYTSPHKKCDSASASHLMIGRRPLATFGNSTGDQQMLEYTGAGDGARLKLLVLHDDAKREYAYGPAEGLPDSKVGTFTQALFDEATSGLALGRATSPSCPSACQR